MGKNVLVVDTSEFRDAITSALGSSGYRVTVTDSAFDAISKLRAYDFDLIVSEVELPGDNAFDLYDYINHHYPYIPTIMTTGKNIDEFFDRIFKEGIGNVLRKPLKHDELIKLADKLITKKDIFGLENYLPGLRELKKIRITSSLQIQRAIELILQQITDWGSMIDNRMILNLVLNEMTINAVYHSHGLTREKERRIPVKLKEGQFVEIFFGCGEGSYGISINDYNGKLTKARILDSINSVVAQDQLLAHAAATGENISDRISETGRGIDLVRKLCGEYYFIIKKNVRTEIIILFDADIQERDTTLSSLKIIEDFSD
ncbi:MAG: response regulator [Spirochaetes bacterium]|nr:response regulator [Spirochaetota bacterium]HPA72338.1 response regulator [Spirochaetota bacterium]